MPEPAKVFEDRISPGDWRVEWEDDDGGMDNLRRPERAGTGNGIANRSLCQKPLTRQERRGQCHMHEQNRH
jgi:hypothetical protein